MRANSQVGTYAYANGTVARHAPSSVTDTTGATQALTYDANGNMLTGLGNRLMTYDGENRPLSATYAGQKTCYYYGADGARLKRIDGFAPSQACTTAPTATQRVTVWLGLLEIRRFNQGASVEKLIQYPIPEIRVIRYASGGTTIVENSGLHRDGLGSVRAVPSSAGLRTETDLYRSFGEFSERVLTLTARASGGGRGAMTSAGTPRPHARRNRVCPPGSAGRRTRNPGSPGRRSAICRSVRSIPSGRSCAPSSRSRGPRPGLRG